MNEYELAQAYQVALAQQLEQQQQYARGLATDAAEINAQGTRMYGANEWQAAVKNIQDKAENGDLSGFSDFVRGYDNPTEIVMELGRDSKRLDEFKRAPLHRQHAIAASITQKSSPHGHGNVGDAPAWRNPATAESFARDGGANIPSGEASDALWNKLYTQHQAKRGNLVR